MAARTKLTRGGKQDAVDKALRSAWWHTDRRIAKATGVSPTMVGKRRKALEHNGEVLRTLKMDSPMSACLQEVSIFVIRPSPENDQLYDPIRHDDPDFLALVEDIRANGLLTPIQVSRDSYIISGHRRYAAVNALGFDKVTVSIMPDVSYHDDRDRFIKLLVAANTQRVKTIQEVAHEQIVGMQPDATQSLHTYKRDASQIWGFDAIKLEGTKKRSTITEKLSLRDAIIAVVNANKKDWPLSDRSIYYQLLNIPGLLRNDVRKIPFVASDECYNDVTNMLTRMRIDGTIPFDCISDETRPVIIWQTFRNVGAFVSSPLN